jgi:putative membrane protein
MRSNTLIALIGGLILIVLVLTLVGGGMMNWGMSGPGHMWGWDVGTGWGTGMMLIMLIFWAFIVVAVIYGISVLVRSGTDDRSRRDGGQDKSLDILRERYARGEISKEEFDQMRRNLE